MPSGPFASFRIYVYCAGRSIPDAAIAPGPIGCGSEWGSLPIAMLGGIWAMTSHNARAVSSNPMNLTFVMAASCSKVVGVCLSPTDVGSSLLVQGAMVARRFVGCKGIAKPGSP